MNVRINPSDLQYRYRRKKESRDRAGFSGPPDPRPFDRDDLYQVTAMFEAVMNALGTADGRVLHTLEEILDRELPRFIASREDVYTCLFEATRERLG
jgi:hypothetical protein